MPEYILCSINHKLRLNLVRLDGNWNHVLSLKRARHFTDLPSS
ncbi:hypothetical protein HDF14_003429 [Edaphobacter lichenicola]|uniref:Uncharacterized protein n=1 Tax=Tunturiibacter gelidiferens TaxID=3069689 RepID=A0A9X0QG82_9BACT|nr:hypothetical protein [Edaphobacter lichenicola]